MKSSVTFSSDRPIISRKEDLLGRSSFAISLAKAIKDWHGKDSLVVGIFGDWGSGKSSMKNMLVEYLKNSEAPPIVIEFNPWMWSGQDRLVSVFFDEIGTAIGAANPGGKYKQIQNTWNKYSARLSMGSKIAGNLKVISELVGVMPGLPLILGLIEKGADGVSKNAEAASKLAEIESDASESIDNLKTDLRNNLSRLEVPLIVILDDIDRLLVDEIRYLLQIIKVNADFPNMVFVILCDRRIIIDTLDTVSSNRGNEYLNKIVQVNFDLPSIDMVQVQSILIQGIEDILKQYSSFPLQDLDDQRLQQFFSTAILPFFRNLRDVRRFLSSYSFILGLYNRDGQLEINIIDLLGIEIIRLMEPQVFRLITTANSIIAPDQMLASLTSISEDRKMRTDEFLKEVNNSCINESNLDSMQELMYMLFPEIANFSKKYPARRNYSEWMRHYRICHHEYFNRYFSLQVPSDAIPRYEVNRLIEESGDKDTLNQRLMQLKTDGKIENALGLLDAYSETIKIDHAENIITSLFTFYDSIIEDNDHRALITPDWMIYHIIKKLLFRIQNIGERGDILLNALSNTDGFLMPLKLVHIEADRSPEDRKHNNALLDDGKLLIAKEKAAKLIEEKAFKDEIPTSHLAFILFWWREFGGYENAKKYVTQITESFQGTVRYLNSLIRVGNLIKIIETKQYYWVSLEEIEIFADLSRLCEILKPYLDCLDNADCPYDQIEQRALRAFRSALARKRQRELDNLTNQFHWIEKDDNLFFDNNGK